MTRFGVASVVVATTCFPGCGPDPFSLLVTVRDTPFSAIRDGDGAWQLLDPDLSGRVRVRIESGRYSLAWSCNDPEASVNLMHSTMADEPRINCTPTPPLTVISGTTSPLTRVYAGDATAYDDGAGRFVLMVPPGPHDVFAIGLNEPSTVVVQRDFDPQTNEALHLPVAEAGEPLLTMQPTVLGDPNGWASSRLVTRHGDQVMLPEQRGVVSVIPASLLVASDTLVIRAQNSECAREVAYRDEVPKLEIPSTPEPTVTATTVSWRSEVEWRFAQFEWSAGGRLVRVSATRDWIQEADADGIELTDLRDVPDWGPRTIRVVPGTGNYWSLYVERLDPPSTFASCEVGGDVVSP